MSRKTIETRPRQIHSVGVPPGWTQEAFCAGRGDSFLSTSYPGPASEQPRRETGPNHPHFFQGMFGKINDRLARQRRTKLKNSGQT